MRVDRYCDSTSPGKEMNSETLSSLQEQVSKALFSHLSPTPLHSIIFQYSRPPSLDSYGIFFNRIPPNKVTVRIYYKISLEGRGKERHLNVSRNRVGGMIQTDDILRGIHAVMFKSDTMEYKIAMETFQFMITSLW